MDGTLTKAIHDFIAIRRQLALPEDKGILEAIAELPEPAHSQKMAHLNELERELIIQTVLAPGVQAFIDRLVAQRRTMGILTRNSYQNALLTLQNVGFSDIFTADNVMAREQARPKPDPEGLNLLLEKWQAAPAEAVFVGDFRDDFIAGRAAGMHTIYVDYDERNQWNDYCHTRVVQLDHLLENQ